MTDIRAGKGRKKRKINAELRAYMDKHGLKKRSGARRQMAAGMRGPNENKAPKP